jgi:hypothetical protein
LLSLVLEILISGDPYLEIKTHGASVLSPLGYGRNHAERPGKIVAGPSCEE